MCVLGVCLYGEVGGMLCGYPLLSGAMDKTIVGSYLPACFIM